jgi:regulator of PEP synthase PpsR (kinase-PPPase family)
VDDGKKIIVVSDGSGRTALRLMDAVLAQYSQEEVEYSLDSVFSQVRDKEAVDSVLTHIRDDYLIIFSIISEELCQYLHDGLKRRGILHLDVLRPMLDTMSKFLGVHPDYQPGILQIIDDRYYKKIDAISYTVEHDDGRGSHISDADLVLVGLSRSCKTPISMYIACNHGFKVANIPIVPEPSYEARLLASLESVDSDRIVGLVMQGDVLVRARQERSQLLSGDLSRRPELRKYWDITDVRAEIRGCLDLYNRRGWQTVDVSRRAIEEVATEIVRCTTGDDG